VSSRLVASGTVRREDAAAAAAQLAGAATVALLATLPVLLFPDSAELDVVRLVLAALIALVGYAVARGAGASPARSMVYGFSILVIATAVALIKNVLAGH
jgi:VIT1/CCC1 family predicted Fe2+/Mn2+ transporter